MSTNKHATIRYHALDKCFSNFGRKFFIADLIDSCNQALSEYTQVSDGVKKRQVFEDIKFMESDQGWSIPLERHKDGKKVYYRYEDRNYSIKNQAINETEAKQLKETLSVLTRFNGLPHFEWIQEIVARLETSFLLKSENNSVVGFDQNPFLKGMEHFNSLFNAIQNHIVLELNYKSFNSEVEQTHIIHPYYLKQYNSRWFLFGYNSTFDSLSNFPLDRIISIKEISDKYIKNSSISFDTYFEDIVGVTLKKDVLPEKISIEVENSYYPYLDTKPIHGSQKIKSKSEEITIIELEVAINYELIALLFSMGENIKVIQPEILKTVLKEKAQKILNKYS